MSTMITSKERFESLKIQIETDYENLKKSFELLKHNVTDKQLIENLSRNYSFLDQDIKIFEKYEYMTAEVERPILGKFLKDLNEIKALLNEVKEFLIHSTS